MPIRSLILSACVAAGAAGCVHTDVHRLARYRPGAIAVQSPAPVSGVYQVKYATTDAGLQKLTDSERIVRKGEPLGFRVAEDGTLLAVAGADEFVVSADRHSLRKCVWYGRSEKPSQFTREVHKAAKTAAGAVSVAGVATGLVAVVVGEAALDEAIGGTDCDDEEDDPCDDDAGPPGGGGHGNHHHSHGGGGGGPKPPKPGGGGGDGSSEVPVRVGSRNP